MKEKLKFRGPLKQYMRTPMYLAILLLGLNILVYMVNIRAGLLVSLGLAVYLLIVLLIYIHHKPMILNALVAFTTQYNALEKRMLEDLALPFAIMDTNGRMVWSNRLFASLMGKDQLYNKNIATLLPGEAASAGTEGHNRSNHRLRERDLQGIYAVYHHEGCG